MLMSVRSIAAPQASLGTRTSVIARLRAAQAQTWDVIVVGGGATGLGTAVDAASRGWKTLLLESQDFASGTSSKATKLLHGGVRYLAQGDVKLVREALHERDVLLRNAPGLTAQLEFVIPTYGHAERLWYGMGMKVYDALAGRLSLARSRLLDRAQTLQALPTLATAGLKGGVAYSDGQFDDAGLAIALARTAAREGALVANYVAVDGLVKDSGGRITGVTAREQETGERLGFAARCVVNATGIWVDGLRRCDRPTDGAIVSPSQGVHLVLDRSFLPGRSAMLVPKTSDGRVLFMVPWQGSTLLGTTDTPRPDVDLQSLGPERGSPSQAPMPFADEVAFLLATARPYLTRPPSVEDVRSAWAGLRPLVRPQRDAGHTAKVSREHTVLVAASGLITVTGGKWTTYRRMAESVLDAAIENGLLPRRDCITATLPLACATARADLTQAPAALNEESVRQAVLHDGALTIEDILARRHRQVFLDARASIDHARWVSKELARMREWGVDWEAHQLAQFVAFAERFALPLLPS